MTDTTSTSETTFDDAARAALLETAREFARREIAPQVAGYGNERMRGDPSADPPQQVVCRDQADEDRERAPQRTGMMTAFTQHVDQMFDRVL